MPKIPRSEPWQHRFVEANGLRFHVVTAGPAGGGPSRGLVLLLHGFRILKGMLAGSARKGPFRAADLRRYAEAFAKPGALRSAIKWYRAAFRGGLPAMRELPKIAAPTLIIWGDRDFALGRELTRGMRAHFAGPFSITHLPGVSHWVQQEAPERVNALLTRFLARRART